MKIAHFKFQKLNIRTAIRIHKNCDPGFDQVFFDLLNDKMIYLQIATRVSTACMFSFFAP